MVTLKSENKFFDTLAPSCCNSWLLNLVYSLWYDRLVMCLYGDLKLAIFKIVLAILNSENMVFGKLSLYGVNSYVSRFVWRLLYNVWVRWLYGDLKLALFKIFWPPKVKKIWFLVTLVFMVSTLMYQGLYEEYCITYGSCDFMMT